MKKSMALFHIRDFACRVMKTSTSGSYMGHILWVSGHGSVGQMDQQVRPTLNPDVLYCIT